MPAFRPRARRLDGGWRRPAGYVAVLLVAWSLAGGGGYLLASVDGAVPGRAADHHPGHVSVLHLHRPGQLAGVSDVWVYRPDVPDSAALPVVYFLHGSPGEPSDIFHAGLAGMMDRYLAQGGTPFVIAAPDGNSSLHADTEWGDASDGSDAVESFVLQKVIPAVEGTHPRSAARRAIAGFSMGGFGAMNIALQHPQLFSQIVSIAGYFRVDDPSQMFASADAQLANSPDAHLAQARGKRILLLEDNDDPLTVIRGQSRAFMGLLERAGVPAVWYMASGAHDLAYLVSQMPIVARFLGRGFATTPGARPTSAGHAAD